MTREEWKAHYSKHRLEQRSTQSTPVSTLVEAIKELYFYIYDDKQDVFIRLVNKYRRKLGEGYLKQADNVIESWKESAKERSESVIRDLVYKENPFLALVPKNQNSQDFTGKYIPIQIPENDE